jgi:proteasome lid subunit RPN8/RPN11
VVTDGPHPGPAAADLPAAIRDAIVAQARAEYPNEACGLIVGDRAAADGGLAVRHEPPVHRPRRNAIWLESDRDQ